MSTLSIKDLPRHRDLDAKAMSRIRGAMGSGAWVFGWIRPYIDQATPRLGGIVNLHQTNNFYVAEQMNNQIQVVDITNSASNATFNVNPNQHAGNLKVA